MWQWLTQHRLEAPLRPGLNRVTGLSALVAGSCLGGGLSLPFLQALLVRAVPASLGAKIETVLPAQALADHWFVGVMAGGLAWGWALGRLSGFRHAWRLGLAGGVGVLLGLMTVTSSPFLTFVNGLWPDTPLYFRFGLELVLGLGLAGGIAGLALGLGIPNWKAALRLALAGSLTAIGAAAVIAIGLGLLGVRVGAGNAAMAKIAALSFLTTTFVTGGMIGQLFPRFSRGR